jgi:hypothetical protein
MRWGKTATAVAAISCGLLIGSMITAYANSIPPAGQPGSTEDPVVTKSYVDEQIQKLLGGQYEVGGQTSPADSEQVNRLKTQIAALEATVKKLQESGAGGVQYQIIVVKPGQTLLGGMGTEFTVRAGKAVISSNTSDGIADLTDGIDLKNGTAAPTNHLLLIPREGRGLKVAAEAKGDVYVTVKGAYLHLDADGNQVVTKTP